MIAIDLKVYCVEMPAKGCLSRVGVWPFRDDSRTPCASAWRNLQSCCSRWAVGRSTPSGVRAELLSLKDCTLDNVRRTESQALGAPCPEGPITDIAALVRSVRYACGSGHATVGHEEDVKALCRRNHKEHTGTIDMHLGT